MTCITGTIVFLGNGRCYHTLDWFRSAQKLSPEYPPLLATDLIESESFDKLIKTGDPVVKLLILDRYLLKNQSRIGNIWRNLLKLLLLPVQIVKFRKLIKKYKNPVVHAHSMYYIAIARFSSCRYVATPQGSEILVRPYKSVAYKLFSRIALSRASSITVDSVAMQNLLFEQFGFDSVIIQNGIDLDKISEFNNEHIERNKVISIRGFCPNYQIGSILDARNDSMPGIPLYFCYPFEEKEYKISMSMKLTNVDHDIGRLSRLELYKLMLSAKLVISIPVSDSSPRSVYEAIFCGCLVATTKGEWISLLPKCMASRIIVIDTRSGTWFQDAINFANSNVDKPYIPSSHALDLFDQNRSMLKFFNEIYPNVARS